MENSKKLREQQTKLELKNKQEIEQLVMETDKQKEIEIDEIRKEFEIKV